MIFYRIVQQTKLHSFGDFIGEVPFLGKKLYELQNEYVKNIGGTITDVGSKEEIIDNTPYFVFYEDLFFTGPFLESCVKVAKNLNTNIQYCLGRNSFNDRFILPTSSDSEEHHVLKFYFQCDKEISKKVVIKQKIYDYETRVPHQIVKGGIYKTDQCDTFALHIISPFHLLFANLGLNLARSIKYRSKMPSILDKQFGQPGGRWFYHGLKVLNKIGKNCKIHPTALLEGAVIGDNVTIEAGAIVRMSILGDNCQVSDNVTIVNSVLGESTFIGNSNYVSSCLTYPKVFLIHGPYQFSVFGKSSACFAVINCDYRLDQHNIKIPTSEGIIDSHQPLLGIAYGHRSKTGGGNIIAAGRIVPNDLDLTPPDHIILNFDNK